MLNRRRLLLGGTAVAAAAVLMSVSPALGAPSTTLEPEGVAWLKANAVPLATAEPGSDFKDLEPLRRSIGNARVVGLGEATHGTREFFQLKHRMMEYCVSQLGFTVIGFEAAYGETLVVNDYVLHGKGTAKDAVAALLFTIWNTEEVLALVEWVRAWNIAHERKVTFYGFDMQSGAGAVHHMLGYLERVAPKLAMESERVLGRLGSRYVGEIAYVPAPERETVFAQIKAVREAFVAEREHWVAQTSKLDWHLARQSADVVEQFLRIEMMRIDGTAFADSFAFRDRCMTDNIHALLDAEGPNAKMLLWAHNGHVQKSHYFELINMGSFLHAELAADYRAIGFAFNQGSFQAMDKERFLRDHTVGPAPAEFVDAALAATGIPLFAIDIMRVPADGPVARWMADTPPQRTIGAGFDAEDELSAAMTADPRDNFDVIIFVDTTTAARGLKWPRRVTLPAPGYVRESNEQPTNLAFTDRSGTLHGWHVTDASLEPYLIGIEDGMSPEGGRALRISRTQSSLPWGDASLTQFFSAAPWRGRRLVFSAAMRAAAPTIGTGAMLIVLVRPKQGQDAAKPIVAIQADGLVRSPGWVRRSVAVDIPVDAEHVQVCLAVTGTMVGWFGDLIVGTDPAAATDVRMPTARGRFTAASTMPFAQRLSLRADME